MWVNQCPKCHKDHLHPFYQGFRCNWCGFEKNAECVDCNKSLGKMAGLRCPACNTKRKKQVNLWWKQDNPPKPKRPFAVPLVLKEILDSARES